MRRTARITLASGGLLVGAAWVAGNVGLAGEHHEVIRVLAEVVAVFLVLLSWRYRRDRLAVVALLIGGANAAIRSGAIEGFGASNVLTVFIAADLVLLAVTRDRPLGRLPFATWIAILGFQYWVSAGGFAVAGTRLQAWFAHPWVIPAAVIAAVTAAAITFFIRLGAFEASLIWVAAAVGAAATQHQNAHATALLMAAATLTVLAGFFDDSYRLAFHDELTGLPGRRALDETLRNLSGVFTIAMADVDRFKRFNDRYGHDAGDQALRMVADEMAGVGGGGRAYRYGGEEFAIVFPGSTATDAREHIETLRRSIAERKFALRGPDRPKARPERPKKKGRAAKTVNVTVSIGLASTDSRRRTADAVIRAADRALYRAKKAGRNRVVAAGDRLKR